MKIIAGAIAFFLALTSVAVAQIPPPSFPSIILTPGSAPGSPVNGQCWTTSAGMFCRIAGSTVGPFGVAGGTVTTASVVTANGFAGTVANPTTTPAFTITTSVNGLAKGNGTALSAATAGTDYLAPTGNGSALVGLLWSQIGSTPTTLAGYGITSPLPVAQGGTALSSFGTGVGTALGQAVVGSGGIVLNVVPTPSAGTDPANKAYVDNVAAGLNPAVAVQAATTQASDTSAYTYVNGAAGIGATLTGAVNTAFAPDGFTFTTVGQRVLVKNDTVSVSGSHNGVYSVTQIQTGILPVILTRVLDFDTPSDMNNTGSIPVVNGTVNAQTSWVLTSSIATVGTDPLTFTQYTLNPTNIAQLNVSQSFTKGQAVTPTISGTQSAGGTLTPDFSLSNSSTFTFGAGNLTVANPTNVKAGQGYVLAPKQDGTGSRTITWGANFKWAGGTAPTLTTTANAKDIISCWADTTTTLNCVLAVADSR